LLIAKLAYSHWSKHVDLGAKLESDWNASLEASTQKYAEEGAEFKQLISLELPKDWASTLPVSLLVLIPKGLRNPILPLGF